MLTQVVAAVVRSDDRYLVCQRPPGKRHGGLWEFPGGKLEVGETLLTAIQRELREELQVIVRGVGEPRFRRRDPGSSFVILFADVLIEGEPKPTEHTRAAWCTIEDLDTLSLAPTDRSFVDWLKRTNTNV